MTLEDIIFEHCLGMCSLPETNPGNQRVSLTLPAPESERRKGPISELFLGGGVSKIETGWTVQKWSTEERGRRDKGPKVDQEVQRYIDARL